MRIIVYDIEIAKPIETLKNKWVDAKRGLAGVSSLVLYDSETGHFSIYDDESIEDAMVHLNLADLLVGFNCDDFDKPALEGYTKMKIAPPQFDILAAIWRSLGARHKGYRLGDLTERMFGYGKSGDGESAPRLFAQKKFRQLWSYNINDVHLTRLVYNYIVEHGHVLDVGGEPLPLDGYPKELA